MNRLSIIFAGFLFTFATAWLGLAVLPSQHYKVIANPADIAIERGRGIYVQNGCLYCHSQQISARKVPFGSGSRLGNSAHGGERLPRR